MNINELLTEKNMTRYRLSKESGVPQATIADICSGKARIEKCAADTLYKIARVLNVSMESLIEQEMQVYATPRRTSFEVFKSNVCHLVKDKGDIDFIIEILSADEIDKLYKRKWFAECFYLLAMVDYLSRENGIPLCTRYDNIRRQKMQEVIYPVGVILMDEAMDTDSNRKESIRNSIPEFIKYNIVESEVRNVY